MKTSLGRFALFLFPPKRFLNFRSSPFLPRGQALAMAVQEGDHPCIHDLPDEPWDWEEISLHLLLHSNIDQGSCDAIFYSRPSLFLLRSDLGFATLLLFFVFQSWGARNRRGEGGSTGCAGWGSREPFPSWFSSFRTPDSENLLCTCSVLSFSRSTLVHIQCFHLLVILFTEIFVGLSFVNRRGKRTQRIITERGFFCSILAEPWPSWYRSLLLFTYHCHVCICICDVAEFEAESLLSGLSV